MNNIHTSALEVGQDASAAGHSQSQSGHDADSTALSSHPPTSEEGPNQYHTSAGLHLPSDTVLEKTGISDSREQQPVQRRNAMEEEINLDVGDPGEEEGHKGMDTDLQVAASYAHNVSFEESLDDLRKKIIGSKGARAQLPPEWQDNPTPAERQDDTVDSVNGPDEAFSPSTSTSSSDSSSSSSEDDDESSVGGNKNISMLSDYDSDDSSPATKTNGDGPRGPMTKSELTPSKAVEFLGKLPFEQVPDERMQDLMVLGKVHGNVQQVLVIAQAQEPQRGTGPTSFVPLNSGLRSIGGSSNERQGPILDAGSLVCTSQGKVIGLIFETFGSLLSPMYSILLPSSAIASTYQPAQDVFYLPSYSTILRPAELRANQGKASDASNVNDEEAGIEEMDFSDDEEEAEYKRRHKTSRKNANSRVLLEAGNTLNPTSGPATSDARGNASRGLDRGHGRGRGTAGRGREGKGTCLSSPHAAKTDKRSEPFALPQRPTWHPDDPTSSSPAPLSYGEPTNIDTPSSGRSRPKAYDSGLFAPPVSAGLPAIPKKATELAEEKVSINATFVGPISARRVHLLPTAPTSPVGPTSAGPLRNSAVSASAAIGLPPNPSHSVAPPGHDVSNHASQASFDASIPPFPLAAPPPGVHINPLFARQWSSYQQQQQQPHPQQDYLPPYHADGRQYQPPAQHSYVQQSSGQGYQQSHQQQHYQHQHQHPHQHPHPHQHQHQSQNSNYPAPLGSYTPQYPHQGGYWSQTPHASERLVGTPSSGLGHIQSSYWPQQQQQQQRDEGAGAGVNAAYDPNNGRLDFPK